MSDQFAAAMGSLSDRDASVFYQVLIDKKTLDEVGRIFGISRQRVAQVLRAAAKRMAIAERSGWLRSEDGGIDLDFSVRKFFKEVERENAEWEAELARIYQEGYVPGRCSHCKGRLTAIKESRVGRPAQYCSGRCRQAAYRVRKAARTPEASNSPGTIEE
ncbi:sigma factor-like helix-turn-helix DNA-binding protein [Streptodolium elevatio]